MSVTVDANVFLYASDESSPRHELARELIARLARGPGLVYLFWPVIMVYLQMSTHPNVCARPLEPAEARRNVDQFLGRVHVRCPGEADRF